MHTGCRTMGSWAKHLTSKPSGTFMCFSDSSGEYPCAHAAAGAHAKTAIRSRFVIPAPLESHGFYRMPSPLTTDIPALARLCGESYIGRYMSKQTSIVV